MSTRQRRILLLCIISVELLAAAAVLWWLFAPGDEPPPAIFTAATTSEETPAPQSLSIWAAPDLPGPLLDAIQTWVAQQPNELAWSELPAADLTIGWQQHLDARPLAEVILVPAAPYFSLRQNVTSDELSRAWQDRAEPEDLTSRILVSPETAGAVDALLGPHSPESPLTIIPGDELADRLWNEPNAVALVPFDRLEPRLKALSVDGLSALDPELEPGDYPLRATIWVAGPQASRANLAAEIEQQGLDTNRHLDRLTVLAMTGVTALARGVAYWIEATGDYAWPARQVADFLSAADLTHISNEVSFLPGCEVDLDTWVFCARPEYLETLHLVGADLVELTGNHNLDFGAYYAELSLDLYAEAGMQTFGGGRNAMEARRPLILTHNGNRLAFLGYNQFGPDYAWADEDSPGAARFSLEAARSDLIQVRPQADVILVSIQHTEAYQSEPLPEQAADFRAVLDAGADVVTGSQAHQPQAIEFYGDKPIFYGLGNLFFDQTWSDATRWGLIVRHVIYDGRLIASEIVPTAIDDSLQTYLAQGEEAEAILRMVSSASGW